ncbi:MAG: hypothetical protein J7K33_10240 [Candidatus Marinimicrobia bacterium]|nr:hypothetical protein [Candidatus Neomarinimicrobiota bacterium]
MNEELEKKLWEVRQAIEHKVAKGEFLAYCDFVKTGLRIAALFGEPATKAVYFLAKLLDYYTLSPEEEAHQAFREKCKEYGRSEGRRIASAARSAGGRLSRLVGPVSLPPIPPPYHARMPSARVYRIELPHGTPSSTLNPNLEEEIREHYGGYADYVIKKRRWSYIDAERGCGNPPCHIWKKMIPDYSRDNPYGKGAKCYITYVSGKKVAKCIYPDCTCVCYEY